MVYSSFQQKRTVGDIPEVAYNLFVSLTNSPWQNLFRCLKDIKNSCSEKT